MGASIPAPDSLLTTKYERLSEKRKERREQDRLKNRVTRSPVMDDANLAIESGFGVSLQEVIQGVGPIRLDEQGTHYNAMLMIATAMFQAENYREAGALYHRGIKIAMQNEASVDPYHYVSLSVCYRKIGLHQRARQVLKEALKKDKRILIPSSYRVQTTM